MEQVLPSGIATAIAANLLVSLYFLALYRDQEKSSAYLYWAGSCGLFSAGAISLTLFDTSVFFGLPTTFACLSLYTASYFLFIGLSNFELTVTRARVDKKAAWLFGVGLVFICVSGIFSVAGEVAITCLLIAAMLLLTEGCFCRRKTAFSAGYFALRSILLGHAFIMLAQGVLTLWSERISNSVSENGPWFQLTLLTQLLLFIATALILPLLQISRRETKWQRLASTDELTGVLNRRAFLKAVDESLASSGTMHSLLMIDVDHFKLVNDTYGHQAGDQVLKQIAVTLRANIRERDLIGRLGGEEFAILMPELSAEEAETIAARILENVEGLEIPYLHHIIKATVSVGMAYSDTPAMSWDMLFSSADQALYMAKNQGRNLMARNQS